MGSWRKHWLYLSGAGAVAVLATIWAVWRRAPAVSLDAVQAAISGRDAARAEQLLDSYLQQNPEDWQAHLMLAGVLVSRNDLTGGLQHLDRIPDSSEWSVEARFREGSLQRQLNRAQAAERAWLRCLQADEATQTAATELAQSAVVELVILYSLQGRRSELEQVLWSWHARLPRPQRSRALIALLNVQFGSPPTQTAIPELEKFVQADHQDYESRRALGRLLVAQPEQATMGRKLLEECVAAQPTNEQSLAAYLESLIALADLPTARDSIARLPDSASATDELWHLRGSIYQLSEEWENAAEALQQSLRNNPKNHEVHARLADVLHRLGRDADADEHGRSSEIFFTAEQRLRSANDLFQATERLLEQIDTLSTFTVGELYERAGYVREAQAWYEETLRRDSQHADAHAAIDRLRK